MIEFLLNFVFKPIGWIAVLLVTTRFLLKTFYHKKSVGKNPRLTSSTVIVTGGSSGIGKATVNELLLRGSRVIFTGRDVNAVKNECIPEFLKSFSTYRAENLDKKGVDPQVLLKWEKEVMDGTWDESGNYTSKRLWFRRVDFSDLNQIQKFADWVKSEHSEIYALVNNAGGVFYSYMTTVHDLEWTISVNHLSHHLLTDLLFPKLCPDGRIVNVASYMSEIDAASKLKEPLDFDLFFYPKPAEYKSFTAYSLSKLANVLFARGVQSIIRSQSSKIISVSLHPGTVRTNFMNRGGKVLALLAIVMSPFIDAVFKTNQEGVQTTLHCLTAESDQLVPGGYYSDCRHRQGNKIVTEDNSRAFLAASARLLQKTTGRPLSSLI